MYVYIYTYLLCIHVYTYFKKIYIHVYIYICMYVFLFYSQFKPRWTGSFGRSSPSAEGSLQAALRAKLWPFRPLPALQHQILAKCPGLMREELLLEIKGITKVAPITWETILGTYGAFILRWMYQQNGLLVGGIPTPLKNMKVSWDYSSQYMENMET